MGMKNFTPKDGDLLVCIRPCKMNYGKIVTTVGKKYKVYTHDGDVPYIIDDEDQLENNHQLKNRHNPHYFDDIWQVYFRIDNREKKLKRLLKI